MKRNRVLNPAKRLGRVGDLIVCSLGRGIHVYNSNRGSHYVTVPCKSRTLTKNFFDFLDIDFVEACEMIASGELIYDLRSLEDGKYPEFHTYQNRKDDNNVFSLGSIQNPTRPILFFKIGANFLDPICKRLFEMNWYITSAKYVTFNIVSDEDADAVIAFIEKYHDDFTSYTSDGKSEGCDIHLNIIPDNTLPKKVRKVTIGDWYYSRLEFRMSKVIDLSAYHMVGNLRYMKNVGLSLDLNVANAKDMEKAEEIITYLRLSSKVNEVCSWIYMCDVVEYHPSVYKFIQDYFSETAN